MKFITHLIRNFRRWKQERDYRKSIRMTDYIGTYFVPATGYPELEGTAFDGCIDNARQAVTELNLRLDSGPVLDLIVLLKARQLFYEKILRQRSANRACALSIRSAAIVQCRNHEALVEELKDSIASVEAELAALGVPEYSKQTPSSAR